MKRESWKIMLACALGAGIGSFISLEITSIYFIWVGLIIGGLVGYLAYDFRRVIRVIPAAYCSARGWQPDRLWWKAYFCVALAVFCAFTWITVLMFWIATAGSQLSFALILWDTLRLVILTIGLSLLFSLVITNPFFHSRRRTEECYLNRAGSSSLRAIFWTAPPIVIFYHLPRGIWWIAKRMPSATWWVTKRIPHTLAASACFIGRTTKAFIFFLGRFGWQMFIRVHSQRRLICGTDAMIGAAIGYLAGSAIIGALSGALVGLVNYELVTRRWLIPRGHVRAPVSAKS